MYVRLALAVAAHLEPEILIIDEVLAVGDAEFQKKCLGKMKDVSGQGRTVLFVSHNMSSIKELCNQGLLLENGALSYSSGIKQVIDAYMITFSNRNKKDFTKMEFHTGERTYGFISDIALYNPINKLNSEIFMMGETIIIKVKIRIHSFMRDAEVGVKISSMSGIALTYLVSCWEGLVCVS